MFVIAVPSLMRLVWSPSASAHAIESLFASVMKTPAKPASSAARDHSIRRTGGLSGRIVQASAMLAIRFFPFVRIHGHSHHAEAAVKPLLPRTRESSWPLDFFARRIYR